MAIRDNPYPDERVATRLRAAIKMAKSGDGADVSTDDVVIVAALLIAYSIDDLIDAVETTDIGMDALIAAVREIRS